jgi:hypothetical protein
MTYKTRNAKFRQIAELQGPCDFSKWVLNTFSGQTGGNIAYVWRIDHMLTQEWVRHVIQCYALRPAHYEGAPYRQAGYNKGSRPIDWQPDLDGNLEGDLETGEYLTNGVKISGPDFEHFPLAPLVAIAKSHGYKIKTQSGEIEAQVIAMHLLKSLGNAHAGMIRTKYGITDYVDSDRSIHYILRTATDGIKLGFLDEEDLNALSAYIATKVIPHYKKLPYGSGKRVYNGLFWALPALYDAWALSPKAAEFLLPVLKLKAKCCLQLAQLLPGEACTVTEVTQWGPNIAVAGKESYYGPWGIRAMLCAAKLLGSIGAELCEKEAMTELAKWKDKPGEEWKAWAVDANGNYLW